ncbi:hypothetical protein B296_00058338 [Ensete ventricosum]|uniref:Uncharacterized protein n=1 Tax=Ensete ventricosum TaxID=4639 RepID=A0A426XMM4_ENSVE|nr:hypothetical protein B296_00058338 [Ensete ventricosum]
MVGGWLVAVKVEEQQGSKNAALIPSIRVPQDSKLGLISVGDRPSLELCRDSSLLVVGHNG